MGTWSTGYTPRYPRSPTMVNVCKWSSALLRCTHLMSRKWRYVYGCCNIPIKRPHPNKRPPWPLLLKTISQAVVVMSSRGQRSKVAILPTPDAFGGLKESIQTVVTEIWCEILLEYLGSMSVFVIYTGMTYKTGKWMPHFQILTFINVPSVNKYDGPGILK